jgi:hypothetical protein
MAGGTIGKEGQLARGNWQRGNGREGQIAEGQSAEGQLAEGQMAMRGNRRGAIFRGAIDTESPRQPRSQLQKACC